MRRRTFLSTTLASPFATPLFAQAPAQPRPRTVFEAGIDLINLTVSVTDGRSRFVTDLLQDDFVVFEDGIRQEISLFTHENLPISLSLLIDTSASMDDKLEQAQSAAVKFIKTLRTQDLAQVIQFSDRPLILQDFTDDHGALDAAVNRTLAAGATALHNALYVALKELSKQKNAAELRRRAIILLSDGEDTASIVTDDQVLELAKKTEIAIYSINIRQRAQRDSASFSQAAYLLTALSRDTGGQAHFAGSVSELDAVYDRIAEELRTQYSMGYVSSNKRKDGKWRRVVVRAATRENLQIRHKVGYFAGRA